MKVLTVSAKTATIITLITVAVITAGIVLVFGGTRGGDEAVPEIEIVLPKE